MRDEARGFTLIELVIGMLVLGIALVLLTSVLFPQSDHAAQTLHRVRSAELAQAVINEIWGKRYDEHSGANGGLPACDGLGGVSCTQVSDYGPDGESRDQFDDIDDYHGLNEQSLMLNSSLSYQSHYPGYSLSVQVSQYQANSKLVTVTVTTPAGEAIRYDVLRSNF
ncbi:prepilin-type N-terminal cleavage/methylation domain-containing protein [Shewanella algae]|uniref:type IV pilus modification PilV family protein n=1 Tax=Shewanella algae TaxID=38313 RepID=UPI001AAD2546|nr:prepilin-type N-terminal cleavage/methylation domain-containing protein [Shewanella algae]MBO2605119.1 prepilin-type N-terminal cleavage/methylation domain-containing protein [Shewanella algae]